MICFGTWGLLSSVFPAMSAEIFLGMIFPWIIFLFSVSITRFLHKKNSSNLTKYFSFSMLMKMVVYGIIIIAIFTFISFNPTPFIISFTSYYLTLHLTEAFIVRSFIDNN
tara:strand:+ start:72 stop:401 length:330 start_codon:yes stop_codon:yes gene_type:complete